MPDTTDPPSTPTGPERRARDRTPPPRIIGEARVRPGHARRELGLDSRAWYLVLERNPEALEPVAQPGYLWIDVQGHRRHVWARHFHIRTEESRE